MDKDQLNWQQILPTFTRDAAVVLFFLVFFFFGNVFLFLDKLCCSDTVISFSVKKKKGP